MEYRTLPIYTAVVVNKNNEKYSLEHIQIDFVLSENYNDLAKKLSITIPNYMINNKLISSFIGVKDKIYAYADTGNGKLEVFRGYVWETENYNGSSSQMKITAYDHLIYLQNSMDNFYFSKGKSTKSILKSIFDKWGMKFEFKYESITHPKLIFRQTNISDIVLEILEEVKKKTGKKYVIRSIKGIIHISETASNTTYYELNSKQNVISASKRVSMDGMVTKVIITGTEDGEKNPPVVAVVKGNTSTYGTLQEIISKDDDTTLASIKKEANTILKDKGKPFIDASVNAVDIPWINKGDKIKIKTGNLVGLYYILGIEHNGSNKQMSLEVELV